MHYLLPVYFPLHVSNSLPAHHQEVLWYIYINFCMASVYVDFLLTGSITILSTASMWDVALHKLFSTRARPHSVTFLPIDSGHFRAKTYSAYIP